jgi:hypothetical protein
MDDERQEFGETLQRLQKEVDKESIEEGYSSRELEEGSSNDQTRN